MGLEEGVQYDFDWILRGGTVIDGSGKEGFLADVGILDGEIAAVGDLSGDAGKKHARCDGKACYAGLYRHPQARGRGAFPGRLRQRGALSGTDDDRQRQLRALDCPERRRVSKGDFRLSHPRDGKAGGADADGVDGLVLAGGKRAEARVNIGMLTGGYIAEVSTFDKAYLFGACLTIVSMLYFNIKVTPHYHKNKLR